jgi:hypothetical protein
MESASATWEAAMTACTLAPAGALHAADERLLLRWIHATWRDELRGVLEPARRSEAGIWTRWNAIQRLDRFMVEKFSRSDELLRRLRHTIPEDDSTRLWAAGELLDSLHWQLDHLVGICHRAEEFSLVTLKFLEAFSFWCREVEDALGSMTRGDLSAECSRHLALLEESSNHGS